MILNAAHVPGPYSNNTVGEGIERSRGRAGYGAGKPYKRVYMGYTTTPTNTSYSSIPVVDRYMLKLAGGKSEIGRPNPNRIC